MKDAKKKKKPEVPEARQTYKSADNSPNSYSIF